MIKKWWTRFMAGFQNGGQCHAIHEGCTEWTGMFYNCTKRKGHFFFHRCIMGHRWW